MHATLAPRGRLRYSAWFVSLGIASISKFFRLEVLTLLSIVVGKQSARLGTGSVLHLEEGVVVFL